MKRLFDAIFLFYCGLWVFVKICRISGFRLGCVNDYLTDIIAVPVIAHISFTIASYLTQKTPQEPRLLLTCLTVYVGLVFEWMMPCYSKTYTSDMIDIVCYCLGGLLYYYVHLPRVKPYNESNT